MLQLSHQHRLGMQARAATVRAHEVRMRGRTSWEVEDAQSFGDFVFGSLWEALERIQSLGRVVSSDLRPSLHSPSMNDPPRSKRHVHR